MNEMEHAMSLDDDTMNAIFKEWESRKRVSVS